MKSKDQTQVNFRLESDIYGMLKAVARYRRQTMTGLLVSWIIRSYNSLPEEAK